MKRCEWCYRAAEWQAHTPRHDGINLCQSHYNTLQRDMRAERLARLSPVAVEIVRAFRSVTA